MQGGVPFPKALFTLQSDAEKLGRLSKSLPSKHIELAQSYIFLSFLAIYTLSFAVRPFTLIL